MPDPRNRLLSWIEVDADALGQNLALFRSLLPAGARLLLVVKANAYGHGLSLITRLAQSRDVDALGVHQIEEAAAVRAAGWTGTILIMGYVPQTRLQDGVDLGVEFTVFDLPTLETLDAIGQARSAPVPCHLKLETGTYRQGVAEEDLESFLDRFRRGAGLRLAGLSTHFANIEDTTDHSYARAQLEKFQGMAARVRAAGFGQVTLHAACTAALLTLPETGFDLARVGIGAYGLWPSRETLASARSRGDGRLSLRPVLTWKARVTQVKWVPPGAFVGYGCAHRTSHRTRLAVIPVGYSDGYDRGLSGLAHVLIGGMRAPVLGRICMNMFMVDVTDLNAVNAEDEAVLIGRQGTEEVRTSDLASQAQTIPYEIVSRLSSRLPRFPVSQDGRLLE